MAKESQRYRHVCSRSAACRCRACPTLRLGRGFGRGILVTAAYTCFALNLFAQTPDFRLPAEPNKTSIAITDSKSDNSTPTRVPTRIIASHSQNGNQTLDNRSVQIPNSDGHFEPFQEIEKQTLQVDATTLRTTIRTF